MDILLTKESKCPMGKHEGKLMKDVPADYLLYMYDNNYLGRQMRRYVAENIKELKSQKSTCFCGAKFDGISCNNCGFDACEVDIY